MQTLLNKYGVRQLGYYVRSIDETADHMARMLGAGPFLDAGESTPEKLEYRGKPSMMTTRVALGNLADMQIELIEVTSDGPDVYKEAGHFGLHHVCIWTDDLEQTIAEFEAAGFEQAVHLVSSGMEVVYFDCREAFGHYVEVTLPSPDIYEGIKSMAEDWDGEDVLLKFG